MDPDGLEPLDPTIRAFLERWYQTDFSRVQVHGGFFAHILANRALAITFGNHIFMSSAGWQQYKAVHDAAAAIQRVIEGVGLVGHEVTHTLQARPMGTLSFVLSYLHEWASVGFDYNKIPYELQAYANESNIVAFLLQNPDIVKSIQNGTYAPAPRSGTYGGASINIFNPVTLTLQSDRTFDICGTDPVCQNVVGFYVRRE